MVRAKGQRVRCDKCKELIGYIPNDYELNIGITCNVCFTGRKNKKKKKINTATSTYAGIKKGVREDVHPTYSFRSPTEANVARIFNKLGATWKYEERSFTFEGYAKGPYCYIMDFEIIKLDHRHHVPEWLEDISWIEVKGWMNSSSRQKLRRLKKQYPEDAAKTLVLLYSHYDKKATRFCESLGYKYYYYDNLSKEFKDSINKWEGK